MMRKEPVAPLASEAAELDSLLAADVDESQIMVRPDGYYWQAPDGKQEFGPFESRDLALADMECVDDDSQEPGETLREAEDEIGITDWIDPETGQPAEGQSTPRFEE